MRKKTTLIAASLLALCGCATTSHQDGAQVSAARDNKKTAADPIAAGNKNFRISRYVGVETSLWEPSNDVLKSTRPPQNYSDLYTRIELEAWDHSAKSTTTDSATSVRDYKKESRGFLERQFASKKDTVTTTLNIEVRDPGLNLSLPLFSVTHESGRRVGNTWETYFASSSVKSPLFRIGPNTAMTVHVKAGVSSDVKSQASSLAIGAITKAVQIAAPASTLLTKLSKEDVTNTANALDSSISAFLSQKISEDIELGRLTDSWNPSAKLQLFGCAPFVKAEDSSVGADREPLCGANEDLDGQKNIPVGLWVLGLSCPRLSAFDPRDICGGLLPMEPASVDEETQQFVPARIDLTPESRVAANRVIASSVSDAQILSFNMSSQVSVLDFVRKAQWFSDFNKAGKSGTGGDYSKFCLGAVTDLEQNGFSTFDSALVVRAMVNRIPEVAAGESEFRTGKLGATCREVMAGSGVTF